jgi:23S rRNA pseudouridine2457 synthase
MNFQYFAFYKPFNVICQFTAEQANDVTLADLGFTFPKDCYSVGRLDKDSEGLLLVTNDNYLKTKYLNPKLQHRKTYYAQVEGVPTPTALQALERGVFIAIDGKKYKTLPAKAVLLNDAPTLPERNPPIRYRVSIPTSWLSLDLVEGKNRQVRKMCAAVGFPVLRLVRVAMEDYKIEHLIDSQLVTPVSKQDIYNYLKIR